jgi:hypothetical protein
LLVILPSGEDVAELQPQFDAVRKCPGRGIIVSGAAPPESGFDYYSRFFCPKFKVNEVKRVSIWSQHNVIQALDDMNQPQIHLFIALTIYFCF